MKTQISNLINGSENTIRNLAAAKYVENPVGFYSGKNNVPVCGGTPTPERTEVAIRVSEENPGMMHIVANGVDLTLARVNSTTGKSWRWEAEITPEQYEAVTGKEAPTWSHKNARHSYGITMYDNCTVEVSASSGKKGFSRILGEEFIEII